MGQAYNPTEERFYVYRLIDAQGEILYIGRSCDPARRLRAHLGWNGVTRVRGTESWPARVTQIDAWGPYTWDEAVRRERLAIKAERPPFNIAGLPKRQVS